MKSRHDRWHETFTEKIIPKSGENFRDDHIEARPFGRARHFGSKNPIASFARRSVASATDDARWAPSRRMS